MLTPFDIRDKIKSLRRHLGRLTPEHRLELYLEVLQEIRLGSIDSKSLAEAALEAEITEIK